MFFSWYARGEKSENATVSRQNKKRAALGAHFVLAKPWPSTWSGFAILLRFARRIKTL